MRSPEWALFQYDWCLYDKGKFGQRGKTVWRDTGRTPGEDRGLEGCFYESWKAKDGRQTTRNQKEARRSRLQLSQREHGPASTLISD